MVFLDLSKLEIYCSINHCLFYLISISSSSLLFIIQLDYVNAAPSKAEVISYLSDKWVVNVKPGRTIYIIGTHIVVILPGTALQSYSNVASVASQVIKKK